LQLYSAPTYAWIVRGQGGGPKTQRGKAASSRNAVKHGLTSDAPVISSESHSEWQEFLDGIIESYRPVGQLETEHATTIASLMWRRRRVPRYEAVRISDRIQRTERDIQVRGANLDGPVDWDNLPPVPPEKVADWQQHRILPPDKDLVKIMKYEAHLHRMQIQTQHELEALQSRRKGEHSPLARIDFSGPPLS
jgi:hypothetical protein